jgi:heme exporter protein B
MNHLHTIFLTDLRIAWRTPAFFITSVLFFFLILVLVPFTLGPEPELLYRLAPGIIWLAIIVAGLLGLERWLTEDATDGTLDLLLLATPSLPWLLTAKLLAQWLATTLPLLLLLPIAGLLLHWPLAMLPLTLLTVASGSLLLTMLGGIAITLTLGLRYGITLAALLVVPLMIPAVIFGVSTLDAARLGEPYLTPLLLLLAETLVAVVVAPWLTAITLKQTLE